MELRQLRYFVESAEQLNFTKAAKTLFISQSTLSQQIQQLENELGIPLFERVGKRVILSEEGKAFLPYAKQTVFDAQQGQLMIKDMVSLERDTLRIGVTWGDTCALVPAMTKFNKLHPDVRFTVYYREAHQLLDMLHNHEIDFALSFNLLTTDETIDEQVIFNSQLCAIVPVNHPLTRCQTIRPEQLQHYPLAVPMQGMNARRLYDDYVRDNHLNIQAQIEINDVYALLHLLRTGRWVGILADTVIYGEERLKAIPLQNGHTEMKGTILTMKDSYQRNAVKEFIKLIRQNMPLSASIDFQEMTSSHTLQ